MDSNNGNAVRFMDWIRDLVGIAWTACALIVGGIIGGIILLVLWIYHWIFGDE